MNYERIYQWSAKRAGGRITVYGKTEAGNPRRIVGVDTITVETGIVKAIDKDQHIYQLVTHP